VPTGIRRASQPHEERSPLEVGIREVGGDDVQPTADRHVPSPVVEGTVEGGRHLRRQVGVTPEQRMRLLDPVVDVEREDEHTSFGESRREQMCLRRDDDAEATQHVDHDLATGTGSQPGEEVAAA
jgi:hypothetical protein